MPIKIEISDLDDTTLTNILSEHILREGTDYGQHEIQLAKKIDQLKNQLQRGDICLVYDESTTSCNLLPKAMAESL